MRHLETSPEGPQLLTIAEVMALLHCSRATVYRFMGLGYLPWCMVGSRRRVRLEDLEAYLVRSDNSRPTA